VRDRKGPPKPENRKRRLMTDTVRAPAAATAQGPRMSDPATSEIGPEDKASASAKQEDALVGIFEDMIAGGKATAKPENQANGFYGAYSIKSEPRAKRFRRTKAAIGSIRDQIKTILEESNPQTVRQVFYALTVRGAVAKVEGEYQKTVCRLLVEMRERGQIPFDWIADNTRWMRKPSSFTGIKACLNATAEQYRRNLWASMPVYVEVWCEKDALAGVLMEETKVYDVPLMVAKGYSSISFLHSAAKAIEAKGKPAYIYHFGDLDSSGRDAARDIEAKLRRYAPGAEIHFECPAVTPEQVERWNLPTRPTKQTDTRAKKFGSATSVELDAIPADKLRALVREVIERHVDQEQLKILKVAEESERAFLRSVAAIHAGAAP
jgi:hypothetical protein